MTEPPGRGGGLNPSGSSSCSLGARSLGVRRLRLRFSVLPGLLEQRGWALARSSPALRGTPHHHHQCRLGLRGSNLNFP